MSQVRGAWLPVSSAIPMAGNRQTVIAPSGSSQVFVGTLAVPRDGAGTSAISPSAKILSNATFWPTYASHKHPRLGQTMLEGQQSASESIS